MKKLFVLLLLAALAFPSPSIGAGRDSAPMGKDLIKDIDRSDSGIPIGTVAVWPHSKLSDDSWAFCDGSKAGPEYIDATGKTYLPDYRGVILRGSKGTAKGNVQSGKGSMSSRIDKNVNKTPNLGEFEASNLGEHRHVVGRTSNQWGYSSHGYGAWLPYPGHSSDPLLKEIGTITVHHNVWTGWESYDVTLSGKALPYNEKTGQVLTDAKKEQMPANVTVNYIVKIK